MKKSFFQFPENMSTEVRSAVQIATVIAAVHFLAVPYYLYLIFSGEPSTVAPFQALVAITVVLTVLFGISAVLSRRGKSTAGMILLLGILSVSYPPVSALLVSGLGSVLGSALIFVGQ